MQSVKYFHAFLIFLVLFFIGIANSLIAQSKIGIEIGRSHSKFVDLNSGNLDFYTLSDEFDHKGFLINLNYVKYLNKYFSLRPSIGYVKRGTNLQTNFGIIGYDKFSLNYLNASLLVGISPLRFIYFTGGVNIGYLIKATDYASRSYNSTDDYYKLDIGLKSGVAFIFKNITIGANYFHSLKAADIIDLGPIIDPEPTKVYNRSLEFSIGYLLNLNKKINRF